MSVSKSQPRRDEAKSSRRMGLGGVVALLGIGALLIVLVGIVLRPPSGGLQIDARTTYVTEPLTADGQRVDYFAAVEQASYPDDLATEDNGYRLLVQRLGPSPDMKAGHVAQLCEKLGLDPARIRADLTYQEPYDWIGAYVKSPDFDAADRALVARLSSRQSDQLGAGTADGVPAGAAASPSESPAEGDAGAGDSVEPEPLDDLDIRHLLEERLHSPWDFDELPMMEDWLAENGPALDLISQAVRKPTFYIPLVRGGEEHLLFLVTLPEVQRTRGFARGLNARAQLRIGSGDLDGAIDDIIASKRFGRHLMHQTLVIDLIVGIAIEGMADAIGLAGSPEHIPSREQLQRLRNALDELPPRPEVADKYRCERLTTLEIVQSLAHGDGQEKLWENMIESGPGLEFAVDVFGLDWNIAAERLNTHYNALIEHGTVPTLSGFRPGLFFSLEARSEYVGDLFAAQWLPALEAVTEATHRHQCSANLKRIVLAMLLYERDHGTLPPACTIDEQGRALHSWRVLLLPYLGQRGLYEQIRLDEPWDSEHNRVLHGADVSCYQCPSAGLAAGQTTYTVVTGEGAPFDLSGQGRALAELGARRTNWILVTERQQSVCWMDPGGHVPLDDALAGINAGPDGIGSYHPDGAMASLSSGATQFVSETGDLKEEVFPLLGGD